MSTIISPQDFTKTTSLLRSFFSDHRGFLEVHTQNRPLARIGALKRQGHTRRRCTPETNREVLRRA